MPCCTQIVASLSSSAEFTFGGLADDEPLPVVIIDAGRIESELGVAQERPARVAHENVDIAGLQRGEAVLGGQGDELHLVRVVEDRSRDGTAKIDIEAGPVALGVRQAEAGQLPVGAAIERAPLLDRVEGCGMSQAGHHHRRCGSEQRMGKTLHF